MEKINGHNPLKFKGWINLILYSAAIIGTLFYGFISSWAGNAVASVGGLIRDLTIVISSTWCFVVLKRYQDGRTIISLATIFLLCYLLQSIYQAEAGLSFQGVKQYVLMIFFPITASILTQYASRDISAGVILFSATILSIVGLIEHFYNPNILSVLGYDASFGGIERTFVDAYGEKRRSTAGVGDALNYGYTMAAFAIYSLALSINRKGISRGLVEIVFVLCSVATFVSYTRGAILGLGLGAVLLMVRTFQRLRMVILGLIFSVAVIQNLGDLSDFIQGRFLDLDIQSYESSLGRLNMFGNSIEILAKNPLGLGLGSQTRGEMSASYDNRVNTDNTVLALLVETGIILGASFIIIQGINFKTMSRNFEKSSFGNAAGQSLVILAVVSAALSNHMLSPLGFNLFIILYCQIQTIGTGKRTPYSLETT